MLSCISFMNKAYLLIGGNLGNREQNLEMAKLLLARQCGVILKTSSIYETAAWGKTDQANFLNQALILETKLNAIQLIRRILKIEQTMGRARKEKFGPRLIDIDILLFNEDIINNSFLRVPHPELQNRKFALIPLAEIAPGIIHPGFNKTVMQLSNECIDQLPVNKL
ncbi:MAG: 2-amino-4-hydroxy-6-hydroxymethyldihydropteridine diphosphokinase [Bacteroidota bacterium]|nr:2-amino-4-hydroxy-6-hydroxymethyldihydropteridine diphosphokinase [Bacteroidota bacterium]